MINITLNGNKIQVDANKTILEIANDNGIEIPTLCHEKDLKPYCSCWVCAVKITGRRGFATACGTIATEGMEIFTNTDDVFKARKMALELLLSDHYADCESPCMLACPAGIDVQGYVNAIANGEYEEALRIIKEHCPMPMSIGRVCPAFCEKECRRTLIEEPIGIRALKRFVADTPIAPLLLGGGRGRFNIAIVGAGPSGLSCGYYLSQKGYDVDIFEEMPKAGGWLRYGIPEYRLPKDVLDKEIDIMCGYGMRIHTGKKLGRDISLSDLSKDYSAVYLAIGATKAVDMPLKGSDLKGVYLGVDYLKSVALGEIPAMGKKVAVIGGGNTAIDCARTAIRLGSDVTIIYRRTRVEMPAEAFEIDAAEAEGVVFMMLTNPVEYRGETCLQQIVVEIMKLTEPDASGRRKPVSTGGHKVYDFDTVIAAISQIPDVEFMKDDEAISLTQWSTADADENTMYTGKGNIFAGGDFRRGAATAIEAIADGKKAADGIDMYLNNGDGDINATFTSQRAKKLKYVDKVLYNVFEKIKRVHAKEIDVKQRNNFEEVELSYTENEALTEAKRCVECKCSVNKTCSLRKYASEYNVKIEYLTGEKNIYHIDDSHPKIKRDENKCIKCGKCVRICAEVHGLGVLGFVNRGFQTTIGVDSGNDLVNSKCDSCGKCVEACPTGGIVYSETNV
jgi:formate dehydrogenase major subunit